jgi:hypothetical protein
MVLLTMMVIDVRSAVENCKYIDWLTGEGGGVCLAADKEREVDPKTVSQCLACQQERRLHPVPGVGEQTAHVGACDGHEDGSAGAFSQVLELACYEYGLWV